jgi:hypothetical protein
MTKASQLDERNAVIQRHAWQHQENDVQSSVEQSKSMVGQIGTHYSLHPNEQSNLDQQQQRDNDLTEACAVES